MKKIVEEDPRKTSLEKRTPEWFVSQYIQRFSHPPRSEHERLIYDSDDSDVNSDDGTTRLPRHPRRIHKSDVLRLFAAQSEWFVTDNEVKRRKLLPFKPWEKFRKAVRKARWQAGRNNVAWGWPIGREHDPDLESEEDRVEVEDEEGGENDSDDDDDDDTMNLVARNPVIGKTNETVRRKIDKAKTKRDARRIVSSPSPSSSSSDETDPVAAHAYHSDFSEESSVIASDSSDEVLDAQVCEPQALIPPQLFQVPDLPGPDNRWWCRIPDCDYLIDMKDLKEENVQGLSGDLVFYLMENRWRNIREDRKSQSCFFAMASVHYQTHFDRLGLKLKKTGGRVSRLNPVSFS
jgi:hypothetical protein